MKAHPKFELVHISHDKPFTDSLAIANGHIDAF